MESRTAQRLRDARPPGAIGDLPDCPVSGRDGAARSIRFQRGCGRRRCGAQSAAPATRARRRLSCCSRPMTRGGLGQPDRAGATRPASVLATRCGSRSVTRSTETTCRRSHADRGRAGLGLRAGQGLRRRRAASRQAEGGPREKLVPFRGSPGPGIPRAECPLLAAGEHAGVTTSGTLSPCLGVGIGMGYVRADLTQPGTERGRWSQRRAAARGNQAASTRRGLTFG